MKIVVADNVEKLSDFAYSVIKSVVLSKPNAILGLATGSSPLGIYKRMIADCTSGEVSYKNVHTVNLDEYVGLPITHSQSYYRFMHDNLFDHIDIPAENTNLPSGTATDMRAECARYSALLKTMPRDLQLLGIGNNGHVAFNEPGTPFTSVTHVVKLKESTLQANARFFSSVSEVPTQAVTMGISEIMQADQILLVASGAQKAEAVAAALEGEVSEACPASVLQRHPNAIIVLDAAAAKKLKF